VIAVALDEADLVVLQRHFDAAAAGAHVAGGVLDFLRVVIFEFDLGVHAVSKFKIVPRGFMTKPRVFPARIYTLGDCWKQRQRIGTGCCGDGYILNIPNIPLFCTSNPTHGKQNG
jgi:hypothetical protein